MMGYMGFGMQRWVYKMKPRKLFSFERKPSFEALPKYRREFKLKPRSYEEKPLLSLIIIISVVLILAFIAIIKI